ncbi:MAG: hypothetical protein MMC33_005623 [Icmadophila ericetorum]|nr:hypothetical protein [Icmadophila ericetorum]
MPSISIILLLAAAIALPRVYSQAAPTSSKRGLVYVPSKISADASDDQIWIQPGSDLTWYYNYASTPTTEYNDKLNFVPMSFAIDNTFLSTVQGLINSGMNISYVLGFNEPDGTSTTGGSDIDPQSAATAWLSQIAPLRKQGVKLGCPAVTGAQTGFSWLQNFFAACNCTCDFIPIHWYGDFSGLASHMGEVEYYWPNSTLWITEVAYQGADLADQQSFYNTSTEYFDRLPFVERYSWFGSFRSDVSNVGYTVAELTQNGVLTQIGSWYLGLPLQANNIPSASSSAGRSMSSAFGWLSLFIATAVLFAI